MLKILDTKSFEVAKVIFWCTITSSIIAVLTNNFFKGAFTGIFTIIFYYSHNHFFDNINKSIFEKKITATIGYILFLLFISGFLANLLEELVQK